MTAPRFSLRIDLPNGSRLGTGKIALLEAVQSRRSIAAAARDHGMSYRRAWLLVDTMNQCFKTPVVDTLTGGQKGGGARVTEIGHEVLNRYLEMEAKAVASVKKDLAEFIRLMATR